MSRNVSGAFIVLGSAEVPVVAAFIDRNADFVVAGSHGETAE